MQTTFPLLTIALYKSTSLTVDSLIYIRSIPVKVSGVSAHAGAMTDSQIISVANAYFSKATLVGLAYQLARVSEGFGFSWEKTTWTFSNGSGNIPVVVMEYTGLTVNGPVLLDRRFHVENGHLYAEHGIIGIPGPLQGKGFSKQVNGLFFDFYNLCNISKITTYAGLDAGGYVWAMAGFAVTHRHDVDTIIEAAKTKVREKRKTYINEEICNFLETHVNMYYGLLTENKPYPIYQWAQLYTRAICRDLLIGSQWDGELNFDDDVQKRTFEKYLNRG